MSKITYVLYTGILLIAFFLRIYAIAQVPPGVNQDEASIGYTAYSLLHTGKDEYARSFPISFQSFGDWKLPLYIYATVPFVALFGLTEFSVRIVSILAGTITVGLVYFLVEELVKGDKKIPVRTIGFLTMFFLAVAPWHIHLSRVESESNTAVMLMTIGTILFLKARTKQHWLLIPAAVAFVLPYYTYAGNHVFTTLIIMTIGLLYGKTILRNRSFYIAISVFGILFGIIFYYTFFDASKTKLSGISIFGDPAVVHAKIELPRNEHVPATSIGARITHNKLVFAAERFAQNYLNAFSPTFLFISGGTNNAHNIENFGNMYIVESVFFFLGIVYVIAARKTKEQYLMLAWILLAPVAASITKDAPHTNRMFAIFPILPLITALGFWYFLQQIPKNRFVIIGSTTVIAVLFFTNMVLYIDRYFVHFPRNEAAHWGQGYKQLSEVLMQKAYQEKHVIMTKPNYSHYAYLLFYERYNPADYQRQALRYPPTEDGFVHVKSFGRYEFREIDWKKDLVRKNTILVDFSSRVPGDVITSNKNVSQIILADGVPMFTLVETK